MSNQSDTRNAMPCYISSECNCNRYIRLPITLPLAMGGSGGGDSAMVIGPSLLSADLPWHK